jgi:SAM-dependent methyltransferase
MLRASDVRGDPKGFPLYDASQLYDLAFSYRDYRQETDALLAWYRRVRGQGAPASALELASGPAAHAIELSARGVRAAGLDLSPPMCEYARKKAAALELPLEVYTGDMHDFQIDRRFDLAILMLNSIMHVHTLDRFVAHLRAVAEHLHDGGVYVIEMPHPRDFLGRSARPIGVGVARPWRVRLGDLELQVTWGSQDDPYDPITQIFDARVEFRLWQGEREQVHVERCAMRDWTKTELEAATRISGVFEIAELHGAHTPDAPFDDSPESWRMIAVLRKIVRERA